MAFLLLNSGICLGVRHGLSDCRGRHPRRDGSITRFYAEANWGVAAHLQHDAAGEARPETVDETTPLDHLTAHEPDPKPLADWLGTIYSLAKRALGGKHRHGRHFFNVSQVLCVGLLMEREGLSVIDVRELFLERDCTSQRPE